MFVPHIEDTSNQDGTMVTLRSPKMKFKYSESLVSGRKRPCHEPFGVPEIVPTTKPTDVEELYLYNIYFDKDLYRDCKLHRKDCDPMFTKEEPPVIMPPGITIINNITDIDPLSTDRPLIPATKTPINVNV